MVSLLGLSLEKQSSIIDKLIPVALVPAFEDLRSFSRLSLQTKQKSEYLKYSDDSDKVMLGAAMSVLTNTQAILFECILNYSQKTNDRLKNEMDRTSELSNFVSKISNQTNIASLLSAF